MSAVKRVQAMLDADKAVAKPVCPVCGSTKTAKISEVDRYGIGINYRLCSNCALVYASPQPTAEFYTWFYEGHYRAILTEHFNRPFDNAALEIEQRRYGSEIAAFISPYLTKKEQISALDVGGSTGIVLDEIRSRLHHHSNQKLVGTVVDPSSEELALAEKLGFYTIHGTFENILHNAFNKYDLITICKTTDHLISPLTVIKNSEQLLFDDGFLYIDFVDFAFNVEKKGLTGSLKIDHPFNYSRPNRELCLELCGFTIVDEIVTENGILPGYLCRKSGGSTDNYKRDPSEIERLCALFSAG